MSSRCFKLLSILLRTAVAPDALPETILMMQFFLLNRESNIPRWVEVRKDRQTHFLSWGHMPLCHLAKHETSMLPREHSSPIHHCVCDTSCCGKESSLLVLQDSGAGTADSSA